MAVHHSKPKYQTSQKKAREITERSQLLSRHDAEFDDMSFFKKKFESVKKHNNDLAGKVESVKKLNSSISDKFDQTINTQGMLCNKVDQIDNMFRERVTSVEQQLSRGFRRNRDKGDMKLMLTIALIIAIGGILCQYIYSSNSCKAY